MMLNVKRLDIPSFVLLPGTVPQWVALPQTIKPRFLTKSQQIQPTKSNPSKPMKPTNTLRFFTALVATLAGYSATTNAATISIPNHSFELAAIADNTAAQGAANWTNAGVADGFGRFWGGGDFGQAALPTDGNQIAFFGLAKADVRQTLVATYASLTDYEFKIDISGRESYPATAQMTIYLYADGNPANVVKSLTLDGSTVGNDVFHTYTFTATAADVLAASAVGETIGIRIDGTGTTAGDFDLDNVRLEAIAVPEPGSLALLGLAGLLIGALRRRSA
jgi:hypothetical protein